MFDFGACQGRAGIGGGRVLVVGDLGGIDSVVVLVVIGTGVRILVEVHEDILNLGLLRRVHYHHNRWGLSLIHI